MIRNLIDDQDVPMKVLHLLSCPALPDSPDDYEHPERCTCRPDQIMLVVDVRQQRLEHSRCPDCPTHLKGGRGQKRGWKGCPCCGRSWRVRPDGYFEEQLPLDPEGCGHFSPSLAEFRTDPMGDH